MQKPKGSAWVLVGMGIYPMSTDAYIFIKSHRLSLVASGIVGKQLDAIDGALYQAIYEALHKLGHEILVLV